MRYKDAFFPEQNIDPAKKDIAWGLQYAKAAWQDWSTIWPRTVFYNAADKYEEISLYALGKQPNTRYKKWMGIDEMTNNTWLNIDWSIHHVAGKYRDIAISRLIQQEYGIVATPIDETAKGELSQTYAKLKAKLAIRQMMQQQNPEMAQHPYLASGPGEPMDMEELEMRLNFGEQFNRSKDAEEAIQLAFYANRSTEFRRQIYSDLFDFGIAGYKEWLGEDGNPKFRRVLPKNVITNYCRHPDFRDLIHAGEIIDVPLVDLATLGVFDEAQLQEIANSVASKWGNPPMMGYRTSFFEGYDKYKARVMDLYFYSYNDYNWENGQDKNGNPKFSRTQYYRRDKENGKNRYTRKNVKVVYKIKWILGTEYAYDYGLMEDMPRSNNPKKKAETKLPYHFYAYNFYEMRAAGIMEKLIPLIDTYQMTIYRIQNFVNRMVPSGWWIDLDALENVALNKGGKNMTPMEILQLFFETGVLVGRSKDIMGDNVNYKPVIPIENTISNELTGLYERLSTTLNQMQSMVGLNEITDGSTPNSKTLVGVANMATTSTNNALYPLYFAEKTLIEELAANVLCRTQQGLKKGQPVDGYAPGLGQNTLHFLSIDQEIAYREYGIMLEEKTTDDQKQLMLQLMQHDIQNGFLDTSDVLYTMTVHNVKLAIEILSFKVKKNKQQIEQAKNASAQQTIQGQQQSAMMAEQAKQKTLQLEWMLRTQFMERQEQLKAAAAERQWQHKGMIAGSNNNTKLQATAMQEGTKHRQISQDGQQQAQEAAAGQLAVAGGSIN
jgi:hypothetical protein